MTSHAQGLNKNQWEEAGDNFWYTARSRKKGLVQQRKALTLAK